MTLVLVGGEVSVSLPGRARNPAERLLKFAHVVRLFACTLEGTSKPRDGLLWNLDM
jgi:hypothetical protein